MLATMHKSLIFFLLTSLAGCALWRPHLGMTTNDFDSMCRKSGLSYQSRIVQAEGNKESRSCGAAKYYYFVDGKLVRIDQGQLPLQRIELIVK